MTKKSDVISHVVLDICTNLFHQKVTEQFQNMTKTEKPLPLRFRYYYVLTNNAILKFIRLLFVLSSPSGVKVIYSKSNPVKSSVTAWRILLHYASKEPNNNI